MKLTIAIVNDDDSANVVNALNKANLFATKISSTGGYLKTGNTTFLIGVEDDRVQEVVDIISNNARKRTQIVQDNLAYSMSTMSSPMEIAVGGATVFVLDVDRFYKM